MIKLILFSLVFNLTTTTKTDITACWKLDRLENSSGKIIESRSTLECLPFIDPKGDLGCYMASDKEIYSYGKWTKTETETEIKFNYSEKTEVYKIITWNDQSIVLQEISTENRIYFYVK